MKNKLKVNKILPKYKLAGNLSEMPVKIVSGILVLSMMFTTLTGCGQLNYQGGDNYVDGYSSSEYYDYGSDGDYDSGYYGSDENYDSSYDDSGSDFYNGDFESGDYIGAQELNKILSKKFEINDSELSLYQNFISQIKVDYKYSDKFNIDGGLKVYNQLKSSNNVKSNNVIKNNQVSYDDLYNIVKKNNSKYMSENSGDVYYKKINESILSEVIHYIVDTINYNIKTNKKIDLNVLDYKLSNLKICEYDDFGYAFYSHDDIVLALNLSIIPNTSNSKTTALQEVVSHETNHLLQDSLIERDDNVEQNYGFCYQFKNVDLNSLYWVWFVEAAAQSRALKQKNLTPSDSLVYDSGVLALDSLSATSAFVKNTNLDLGSLMVKNDLNELFDYFGCKTDSDKKEILKLMIANNLVLETYDIIYSDAFYGMFPNLDQYVYKKELKGSIGQTQAKIFYRNLAEKIKNKTVSVEEVFSLISIFETELSRNIGYASTENCNYLGDFYDTYSSIQKEFFELIASSLGISVDDVCLYYFSYHNTTNQSNLNNSLLNQEQNQFYSNLYKTGKNSKNLTVLEVGNQIKSKKK